MEKNSNDVYDCQDDGEDDKASEAAQVNGPAGC
jgi:hypothetical protein